MVLEYILRRSNSSSNALKIKQEILGRAYESYFLRNSLVYMMRLIGTINNNYTIYQSIYFHNFH